MLYQNFISDTVLIVATDTVAVDMILADSLSVLWCYGNYLCLYLLSCRSFSNYFYLFMFVYHTLI